MWAVAPIAIRGGAGDPSNGGYVKATLMAAILGLLAAGPALAITRTVDSDGLATGANCSSASPTPYTTIQAAIDAASSGDVVLVCPGTGPYDEQPVIDKPLTLRGLLDATIQPSPMTANSSNLTSLEPIAAGVLVEGTAGVTVESLTVDGSLNGLGDCGTNPVGIYFRNSSGSVKNVAVADMRLSGGLLGCQVGLGIFVQSGGGGSSTVLVQGSSIHGYQKNGITANEDGSALTARNNRVTGLGPVPDIAQNGIQLGFGAAGTLEGNLIVNHVWTGCTPASCSFVSANVLVFEAADGPVVRRNGMANAQVSIYYFGVDGGVIDGNDVTETRLFDGIYVAGDSNRVMSNNVTNSDGAGIFLEGNGNSLRKNRINEAPVGIWNWSGSNSIVTSGGNRNTFVNVGVPVHSGMSPPLTATLAAASGGGRRQGSPVR